jgi:hypothetical protein
MSPSGLPLRLKVIEIAITASSLSIQSIRYRELDLAPFGASIYLLNFSPSSPILLSLRAITGRIRSS